MKKTCVADDSMEGNDPFMLFLLRSRKTTLTKLGERATGDHVLEKVEYGMGGCLTFIDADA